MAEIDLDPSFKYLQANQQRALQGIQMGLEIAGRNQMMEMRRQEFAQQVAQDRIRSNLMAAQANRYNQMAADGLIESELEAAEAEPMQKWVSSFYAAANDPTGKTPFAPPPNVKSRNNVATVQRLTVEAGRLGPLARFNDQQQNLFRQQIEMRTKAMEDLYDLQKYSSDPIYTIDQKDPKGYTVNEPAFRQAMKNRSEATMMKATSGMTDLLQKSDEQLAPILGRDVDAIREARQSGTLPQLLQSAGISGTGGFGQTALMRNVGETIAAYEGMLTANNINVDPKNVANLKYKLMVNKGAVKDLPEKFRTQIDNQIAVLEAVEGFQNDVKEFEQKHPGAKFVDYIGLIPQSYEALTGLIREQTDPIRRDALQVAANFQGIRNQQAVTRSGLTVTKQEDERLSRELGNLNNKNLLTVLEGFRTKQDRIVRETLKRNWGTFDIGPYYMAYGMSAPGTKISEIDSTPIVMRVGATIQPSTMPQAQGATNAPIINMDLIDAEMKRRGMNPNQ